jgi:hypothetical protein
MRQTNGLSIVKPTAIFETKGPWVSMVFKSIPPDIILSVAYVRRRYPWLLASAAKNRQGEEDEENAEQWT